MNEATGTADSALPSHPTPAATTATELQEFCAFLLKRQLLFSVVHGCPLTLLAIKRAISQPSAVNRRASDAPSRLRLARTRHPFSLYHQSIRQTTRHSLRLLVSTPIGPPVRCPLPVGIEINVGGFKLLYF